jgi:glycerophosphoryl diester phosphodiesterase
MRIRRRLTARWLKELAKTGAKIVVWNRQVTKNSVSLAHKHSWKVLVYTINEIRLAHRLIKMGVDGIITNKILLIQRELAESSRDRP